MWVESLRVQSLWLLKKLYPQGGRKEDIRLSIVNSKACFDVVGSS